MWTNKFYFVDFSSLHSRSTRKMSKKNDIEQCMCIIFCKYEQYTKCKTWTDIRIGFESDILDSGISDL